MPAVGRICVLALLIWLVVGTIKIYPFHLAYFNELVGGPGNGYRYLVDSNLDWGQDLKNLGVYLHRNGIAMVKLAYFGPSDPRVYGITYESLPPGQPTTGYIAVSVTRLTGTDLITGLREPGRLLGRRSRILNPDCANAFEWLRKYEPIAKIGYSIFVYHIPSTERFPPSAPLRGCENE